MDLGDWLACGADIFGYFSKDIIQIGNNFLDYIDLGVLHTRPAYCIFHYVVNKVDVDPRQGDKKLTKF